MSKKYIVEPVELRIRRADLKKYLEEEILAEYAARDIGHGQNHIFNVLKLAYKLNEMMDEAVNEEMLVAAVLYHDLGVKAGGKGSDESRTAHNERSAEAVRADVKLREFFSEEEIEEIALACYEHRASYKGERKNLLSKIVADADTADSINFERILAYYEEKNPEENWEERLREMFDHYQKKHGLNSGYANWDLEEAKEMMRERRELLWQITESFEKFKEYMSREYKEWME